MRSVELKPYMIAAVVALACLASACAPASKTSESLASESPEGPGYRHSALNVNLYPAEKLVCEPLGGTPDSRVNGGLSAELYSIDRAALKGEKPESADTIMEKGARADRKIFFSQLNVPTRAFNKGFVTDLGDALADGKGKALKSDFALKIRSVISLADDQEEGLYEFALLSNDGAVLKIRDDEGVYRTAVDNDGDHETRLGCGTETYDLRHGTEKLIELKYFKGQRPNVALVLLMRKVDQTAGRDPACGEEGDRKWFAVNKDSAPEQAYTDLLARGWAPMTKANFSLPQEALFNPCKDGLMATITDFEVISVGKNSVELRWETSLPSTSQIVLTDIATGRKSLTPADNQLRTHHWAVVEKLKANTDYAVQALAITETYGKSMTTHLKLKTGP